MKISSLLIIVTGTFLIVYINVFKEKIVGHAARYPGDSYFEPTDSSMYLFKIKVDQKFGFIDSLGKVVIPPRYEAALEFSEGLCAVRESGLYGFINGRGDFMIKASFDFTTNFHEGLAIAFVKGMAGLINRKGNFVIAPYYKNISDFKNGRAHVLTHTGKLGVINKSGKLVVDTLFQFIGNFQKGVAVAEGIGHGEYDADRIKRNVRVTIIDSLGNPIVPFGKFQEIIEAGEGYFIATIPPKSGSDDSNEAILDSNGKMTYLFELGELNWSRAKVRSGIFRISRFRQPGDWNSETSDAYISIDGKTLFADESITNGEDFSELFAFWKDDSDDYHLIDHKGTYLATFDGVKGGGFKRGLAAVNVDGLWGVIDTTAYFVLTPKFKELHDRPIVDNFIFFQDPDYTYMDNEPYPKYGMADLRGNILIPPTFHSFDPRGFEYGLIKTLIGNLVAYYNRNGQLVWQEEAATEPYPYNIDYMQRGYFYASNARTGHPSRFAAEPQEISGRNDFPPSTLSITVVPDEQTVIEGYLTGIKTYVANTTSDTLMFNAQDNRLYLKMQALNSKGEWQNIEYFPHSWCGNSYHSVGLPNNHMWELSAIAYEGSIRTKLRLELTYVDPLDTVGIREKYGNSMLDWHYSNRRELIVYSNEFHGTINPGQFWRHEEYFPLGIMDPYIE